jgi:hypothetical protein
MSDSDHYGRTVLRATTTIFSPPENGGGAAGKKGWVAAVI